MKSGRKNYASVSPSSVSAYIVFAAVGTVCTAGSASTVTSGRTVVPGAFWESWSATSRWLRSWSLVWRSVGRCQWTQWPSTWWSGSVSLWLRIGSSGSGYVSSSRKWRIGFPIIGEVVSPIRRWGLICKAGSARCIWAVVRIFHVGWDCGFVGVDCDTSILYESQLCWELFLLQNLQIRLELEPLYNI